MQTIKLPVPLFSVFNVQFNQLGSSPEWFEQRRLDKNRIVSECASADTLMSGYRISHISIFDNTKFFSFRMSLFIAFCQNIYSLLLDKPVSSVLYYTWTSVFNRFYSKEVSYAVFTFDRYILFHWFLFKKYNWNHSKRKASKIASSRSHWTSTST